MKKSPVMEYVRKGLFWLLVIVIFVYLLFPFYWAINSSLKTENQLQMTPATFVPRDRDTGDVSPTLQNYQAVFQNDRFVRGLVNSVIVAVTTTAISLAVGAFAAFALGKLRFRGKSPSLYVILSMTMFPQIAVLTGLYAVIRALQLAGYTQYDPLLHDLYPALYRLGVDRFFQGITLPKLCSRPR
jgi:trehalose/maltose transport system permease protein